MEQTIERVFKNNSDLNLVASNFDVRCIEKELFDKEANVRVNNVTPPNYKDLNQRSAQILKSSKNYGKWKRRYESMVTHFI